MTNFMTNFWDVVQGIFGIGLMLIAIAVTLWCIHYLIRHWNE
jgi:hypothetical protein